MNKRWIKPYIFCLIISFLFLMICSKNSFLYKINDWVDANAFFTVGKGMVRGDVPYLDLFEQKGPFLYLIYGIGSLISYTSFIGVFILEVLSFSIFLYFTYKVITLFFEDEKAYLLIPILCLMMLTLKSFSHGGSAEEFALPFLMVSIYYLLAYLKNDDILIPFKNIFIVGILAGCILWIKYTLLGFWFGFMLCIFLLECYYGKYKEAFKNCFIFLFGMLVATIPVLIYFGLNGALDDLWNVYFVVNMNAYPKGASLMAKIYKTFKLLHFNLFSNMRFFIGIVIGFVLLFFRKNCGLKKGAKAILLTCLLTTGIFIYIGGTNYHYYPFIMTPFMLVFLMILLSYFKNIKYIKQLTLLSFLFCLVTSYCASNNTKMINLKEEDYAQYRFAEIIKKSSDQTLLNYGFLDGGFYTISGIRPKFYYFMKNNISYKKYPNMMTSQRKYIREKISHYVVIKKSLSLRDKELIEENYKLIDEYTQKYQTKKITYLLYERKI